MLSKISTIMPQYRRMPGDDRYLKLFVIIAKLLLAAAYGVLVAVLPREQLFILAIPIVVLLGLTLWLMPDRDYLPTSLISRVWPYYLLSLVIWPAYIAIALPGLPWLTPTRIILFITLFIYVYSLATSSRLRELAVSLLRSNKIFWIAFLIWEAIQLVTIAFSSTPLISANKFILNQIYMVGVLSLSCVVCSQRGVATTIIKMYLVAVLVIAIFGIIELRLGYPMWANSIPSFMRVDEVYLGNVLGSQARAADGLYRVRGPFSNSLLYSECLAFSIPFILHWLSTNRSVATKLSMFGLLVLVVYAMVISQSRLGLIGAFVGHLGYLLLFGIRKWRQNKSSIVGPSLVLGFPVFTVLVAALVLSSTTLSNRILGGGAQAASDQSRALQRTMAVERLKSNPFGHGLGTSGRVLGFVSPNGTVTVDSYFVTLLLDLGVAGFVTFFTMYISVGLRSVRPFFKFKERELELLGPLSIVFATFMTTRLVLSQEDNMSLSFILLGMAIALGWRYSRMDINDALVQAD